MMYIAYLFFDLRLWFSNSSSLQIASLSIVLCLRSKHLYKRLFGWSGSLEGASDVWRSLRSLRSITDLKDAIDVAVGIPDVNVVFACRLAPTSGKSQIST
jgi:hypothetical protein